MAENAVQQAREQGQAIHADPANFMDAAGKRVLIANKEPLVMAGALMMRTAAQHGAGVIVIVANNGRYGTIRMHQEREFPGRVSGTRLANPDFAALARAHGCWAETVEHTGDFAPALDRARMRSGVRFLHLKTDVEVITPATTLSRIAAR